ncbi:MAG TPA: hypothetical protein DCR04_00735 [Flavobacteriales bacterium]|nr:hypothetical protein [Flavobacteriales bacterium]
MKKYLAGAIMLVLAIGIVSESFAQRKTGRSKNVDVWMGSSIKKDATKKMSQFLVSNANGYITHAFHNRQDIYTVYDTTLQPISSERFDRLQSDDGYVNKGFIHLKDKAIRLTGKTLNYDKANTVYLAEFDAEALKVGEDKEVSRVDGNGFFANYNDAHLNHAVSEDGSKFVVYFKKAKRPDKLDDPTQAFRFMVFDADLDKKWQQDVEFRSGDGVFQVGGSEWKADAPKAAIGIANNGTVYCWGRTDKGDGYDNDARYHVKLTKVNAEGFETIDLSGDQEKKIRDWTLHGTESGMIMAANYMDWENDTKSWLEKSDGFAFVNWSGAVKQRPVFKFIEFDDDYMTLHQSKSIVKRVDKDSKGSAGAFEDNFVIKGFQNLGDDNYLVLAESGLDSTKFNAHLDINISTYTRRDAQFFSVNSRDGSVNWSTRVPKFQENKTGEGLGYICKVANGKLHVVFNGQFSSLEKEWTPLDGVDKFDKMDNPIVLVTLDMDKPRELDRREKLWTSEKTKSYFETSQFHTTNDSNEGLLYLDDEVGKEQFVRLIFK